MNTRISRTRFVAAVAAIALAPTADAAVSLIFTNVGATTSVATVAPGGTFNFSASVNETATTDSVTGADYEISSSTTGIVEFLSRNSSVGPFSSPNGDSDAYLNSSSYAPHVLSPTNGTDLGTSLTNPSGTLAGPVTSDMSDYSFQVLPGTAPGIYTLGFAGYPGSGSPTYSAAPPNYATTQLNSSSPFILVVTGRIDITNKDMNIKDAGAAGLSAATAETALGYNLPGGGNWNGTTGLTSSVAAADTTHLTAVGVILNNVNGSQIYGGSLGTFDGTTPGPNDLLIKYTWFGDANLDGRVDGSDYSLIDAGYAADQSHPGTVTGWYNGDFNYDGNIDGSDYALIDNAFNNQTSALPASALAATDAAQVVGPVAVPEPAMMSMIALAAIGLLRQTSKRPATIRRTPDRDRSRFD